MLSLLFTAVLLLPQETSKPDSLNPAWSPLKGRVEQPVELGQVKWGRDFERGLVQAKQSAKPVLLLFQEVPG